MNGLFVIYLDIGTLAPTQAEAFVDKTKKDHGDLFKKLQDDGYEVMVLPTRPNSETRVEMISLKDPPTYGLGQISLDSE
ncbi:MAG: hypothetical protein M0R80_02420 [Proteobacteria bacterium]|jgi:hypothetical protein|nr:hypothetical protein [Pseudomonadota bacterium]